MNKVTKINLLFLSLGSIIGSGWLYGAYHTAKAAGNSGIISWIIGGIMYTIIALGYAEVILNKKFPELSDAAGYTFGKGGKTLISLLTWIWTTLIPPIEVQATVQYASNYFEWIKTDSTVFGLSTYGLMLSIGLMTIMFVINIFAINTVGVLNKIITIFKVVIPIIVTLIFLYVIFNNPTNALANISTDLFSGGISGTLTAISTCGIAFSFIGFQTAIFLANESENPQKNVPFAVFGSIFIACVIYILIQITFNLSVPSEYLKDGWANLNFAGDAGPIAGLLAIFGFMSMSIFLYVDAVISPFGTGLSYKIAASRVLCNIGESRIFPKFFSNRNNFGSPYIANLLNYVIGIIFILNVSGWQNMITILCALIILTMSYVPLYALFARGTGSLDTSFKVKHYNLYSLLSFYFSNLMLIWCGWNAIKFVTIIFAIFYSFILVKDIYTKNFQFSAMYHALLPFHMFSIAVFTYYKKDFESIYFELGSQFIVSIVIIIYLKLSLKSYSEVEKQRTITQ
ncbi:APC family permease [Silvanigrella aquatica]|uniref:Amino acid permease n=1 Tax=Silvanigrella aquatica TaxID=1915309 RepID=A0A1L4D060_9BACT|nr:APC family permease [Silvanigrella aquatica]APJ03593.1 hypothetical protein AXG55_06605 [Silvanigrella aquatica]